MNNAFVDLHPIMPETNGADEERPVRRALIVITDALGGTGATPLKKRALIPLNREALADPAGRPTLLTVDVPDVINRGAKRKVNLSLRGPIETWPGQIVNQDPSL